MKIFSRNYPGDAKLMFLESQGQPKDNLTQTHKDYLWLHIKDLPYFRALLRAVESRLYQNLALPQPVLDIGCGDGHFASTAFEAPLDIGLDPWYAALHEAAAAGGHRFLVQYDGSRMPFTGNTFGSAISNSVLEHIPDIQTVLLETARILKPGAPFYFTVPNHNFDPNLSAARILDKLGLTSLAGSYRRFFDRIARHHHLDSPQVWHKRLEEAGFWVEEWHNYYSHNAQRVTEIGHYLGLPALLYKKLTGRWIIVPQRWNLSLTYKLTRRSYDEEIYNADGVCTFYKARRI